MESSPTTRNPLGLTCSHSFNDPFSSFKLGPEHSLFASRLSETNSSSSMHRISDEASEPCSSTCTTATSSPRHISLAKGLLSEAYSYFGSGDGSYVGHADGTPIISPLPPQLVHTAQEHKSRLRNQDNSSLGPLVALLEETQDPIKATCCLKALSFLLLDQANRRDLHHICGLDILLDILQRHQHCSGPIASSARSAGAHTVQMAALNAIASLVGHDEDAKVRLWSHSNASVILDLLSPKLPAAQLLESLDLVARLAFCRRSKAGAGSRKDSGSSSGCRKASRPAARQLLLEPRLVAAVARLLHPTADKEVLHQALALLNAAAVSKAGPPATASTGKASAAAVAMPSWHAPLFFLVPLLSQEQQQLVPFACAPNTPFQISCTPPGSRCSSGACLPSWAPGSSVLEAALKLLLNLSDQPRLCNALYAAGCIAPLLPLLQHSSTSVRVTSTCVLANLVEHELSRRQLSQERELGFLVELLRTVQCSEVAVGLVYILGRLVSLSSPAHHVRHRMHKLGVAPLLQRHMEQRGEDQDQDLALGAAQLLQLLGSPAAAAAPAPRRRPAAPPAPASKACLVASCTAASLNPPITSS